MQDFSQQLCSKTWFCWWKKHIRNFQFETPPKKQMKLWRYSWRPQKHQSITIHQSITCSAPYQNQNQHPPSYETTCRTYKCSLQTLQLFPKAEEMDFWHSIRRTLRRSLADDAWKWIVNAGWCFCCIFFTHLRARFPFWWINVSQGLKNT